MPALLSYSPLDNLAVALNVDNFGKKDLEVEERCLVESRIKDTSTTDKVFS